MKKYDGRRREKKDPSKDFIDKICELYNDTYDDRIEDAAPGGEDWAPGTKANHTSLKAFKRMLEEDYDIELSTAKIRKILITGGRLSTATSRQVKEWYDKLGSIKQVSEKLEVSMALVAMYLPYEKVVYDLEDKSGGARCTERWREKKRKEKEGNIIS